LSDEPESRHEPDLGELQDKSDSELGEMVRQEMEILGRIRGGSPLACQENGLHVQESSGRLSLK
jgi:hypothetical protein